MFSHLFFAFDMGFAPVKAVVTAPFAISITLLF
jgi:hypothetical protein